MMKYSARKANSKYDSCNFVTVIEESCIVVELKVGFYAKQKINERNCLKF